MAERRAQSKYYPPDWDPSKGSINTFVGQHPLRDRARKLSEGILIVRFELPFNIWCGGCSAHIALGVRFNAEKKTIGKYYSTPILSFRMKCHLCSNWIEIHTDPKTSNYVVASGAARKNQEFSAEDILVTKLADEQERARLDSDPMYRLEHGLKDSKKASSVQSTLEDVMGLNDSRKDDFEMNSALRKRFRGEKSVLKADAAEKKDFQQRMGLSIPVLAAAPRDAIDAHKAFSSVYTSFAPSSAASSLASPSSAARRVASESIFAAAAATKSKAPTAALSPKALAALERMQAAGVRTSQKRPLEDADKPSALLVAGSIARPFSGKLPDVRK